MIILALPYKYDYKSLAVDITAISRENSPSALITLGTRGRL